jgi:hypothetical protein
MGSAVIFVTVSAWGSDDAVIGVRAHVVIGARLEADLLQFLLLKNAEFRFGAFGLDQKGNVVFQHNIVGLTCDKPELHASVLAVLGPRTRTTIPSSDGGAACGPWTTSARWGRTRRSGTRIERGHSVMGRFARQDGGVRKLACVLKAAASRCTPKTGRTDPLLVIRTS